MLKKRSTEASELQRSKFIFQKLSAPNPTTTHIHCCNKNEEQDNAENTSNYAHDHNIHTTRNFNDKK